MQYKWGTGSFLLLLSLLLLLLLLCVYVGGGGRGRGGVYRGLYEQAGNWEENILEVYICIIGLTEYPSMKPLMHVHLQDVFF